VRTAATAIIEIEIDARKGARHGHTARDRYCHTATFGVAQMI